MVLKHFPLFTLLGAVAAMQDAVILVNCIYDIENVTFENIKAALTSYKSQRFEKAQEQFNMSKMLGKIIFGHVSYLCLSNFVLSGRIHQSTRVDIRLFFSGRNGANACCAL